jgi:hypothetical protein
MTESTTPAPAWRRPAAPDRHPPKGPVSLTLFPFCVRRPASTVRSQAGTAAADSVI